MSAPMRKPKPVAVRSSPSSPKETILLVEDEAFMRTFLSGILDAKGYFVLSAVHGEDALAMSEGYASPIHLLVTDVMMPVMNGKELADRLCTLRPELKVLFISGFSRKDVWPVDACEDQTDWLSKPFTGPVFHDKVRQILDSVRET